MLAYVGWNALHAPRIDGFQGRYLLLVFALLALVIRPMAKAHRASTCERAGLWLVGWSAVMLLTVEIGLAWHSYG